MNLTPRNIRKIIFIIFIGVLLFVLLTNFSGVMTFLKKIVNILSPVIVGCCMAFVLNVIMRLFDDILFKPLGKVKFLKKIKRPLSIFLAFLLVVGIIVVVALVVGPQMEDAATNLMNKFPAYATSVLQWLNGILQKLGLPQDQISEFASDWSKITMFLQNLLSNYSNNLLDSALNLTVSVVGTVFDTILAIFIAVFVLLKKERICQLADKAAQAFLHRKHYLAVSRIARLSNEAFSNFVAGQCIEALIIGALCFIGMVIFRFPYAGVVSVLVAVTALIPIFGAWLGGGISALLILTEDPLKALLFVVYILVLQQLEGNLIYPKVVGKKMGLPGLLVLIAVIIGSKIGGIAGMLVSVPVVSILYILFKEAVDLRLKKKAAKQTANGAPAEDAEEEPSDQEE